MKDGLPGPEEFERWLKADPVHYKEFLKIIMHSFENRDGIARKEFLNKARALVEKHNLSGVLGIVQKEMRAFEEVLQRPAGSMLAEDRLAQSNARLDEVIDAMLELPEPHRTGFLKQLLPLREKLRAVRLHADR